MGFSAKRKLVEATGWMNRALFRRPLPDRVAFYFHSLEGDAIGAFEELVTFLANQGYRFCSASRYLQHATGKMAFLSFDDNYVTWFEQLPLFSRLGVVCTFYTNTLPIRDRSSRAEQQIYFDRIAHRGRREPLSTGELCSIAAAGHTVACHAHTHRKLSDLSLEEGKREICEAKAILETILGKPVEDFSYPFGMPRYFPRALRAYAEVIGFKTIANAVPCMLYAKSSPSSIERHAWRTQLSFDRNMRDAETDGRAFVRLFGRSPIG